MSAISYYLALPFFYLISLLPFRVLYILSDFLYFILFHVLGYRKQVVYTNLRNSFPGKTEQEIDQLGRKYYKYLCDLTLETFKTLTISPKAMLKHCGISKESLELFNKLAEKNQSVILVLGHLGNWEWAGNTVSLTCKHHLYVIYHPLSNKHFDGLMYRMRSRFGSGLIPMKDTFRRMLGNRSELTATAFIADQTPSPEGAYWMTFLNQDTPIFKGTEVIAKKINYPVVYGGIRKLRRGHYEIFVEMLVENPKDTAEGEITEIHTRRLEKDIIENPELWIWSHRRWKHKRN
ncbi:MAG: lysophospholipid acyltransferase family protein [Chitinophagales bacterium]|nr:lysophospholipid acyltransferase family protein [Chitinophagales bacterium]